MKFLYSVKIHDEVELTLINNLVVFTSGTAFKVFPDLLSISQVNEVDRAANGRHKCILDTDQFPDPGRWEELVQSLPYGRLPRESRFPIDPVTGQYR